jgi:hypothetical protein
MNNYNVLFLAVTVIILSGCKMAGETKSGWYTVQLKDESGALSGKTILQVNGERLSRGLHQAILQYHTNYRTKSNKEVQELFVIITNRRKSEDYIIVTAPDDKAYRFPVYQGGLLFDLQDGSKNEEDNSITKLVELMNQHGELKISQGSFYFTINTAGFNTE